MENTKVVEMVKKLVDMKGESTYEYELLREELYKECIKELRTMVNVRQYSFSSDYAQDDFEQDVMISVFEKLNQYDVTRGQFNTWIRKIGSNTYNKFYNVRKHLSENGLRTISMYVENDENEVSNIIDYYKYSKSVEKESFFNISSERLYKAIAQLRDNYRKVVILCDIQGIKPGEAAKMLGEKREIVYRWLNRAHDNLKKIIVNEKLEEDIYEGYEL